MDQKVNPSLLVYRQLPAFIVQDYPQFALFLRKYYEWAEQTENGVGRLRNIDTFWDVDVQNDENILQLLYRLLIREIPNAAAVDRKFLLKNISEFYRSKGSVESIETLFRILYGEEIELYLPREDIIKASEGNWRKTVTILIDPPTYLNGDEASIFSYIGAEVFQTDEDGDILARGVVEDIEENGAKKVLYMSIDKQLKDFDPNLPLRAFDNSDPEVEARLEAKVSGGRLSDIIIRGAGRGYKRTPNVVIEGGRFNAGFEASASVTIQNGIVTGVSITNPGRNYLTAPRIRVVNEIRTTIQGNLGSTTILSGGEFYQEQAPLFIENSNGTGEKFTIDSVRGGSISNIFVEQTGDSYSLDDAIVFDNTVQGYNNKLIKPDEYQYSIWFKQGLVIEPTGSRFKYRTLLNDGSLIDTVTRKEAKVVRANGKYGVHQFSQTVQCDTDKQFTLSAFVKLSDASEINGIELMMCGELSARLLPVISGGELLEVSIVTDGGNYTQAPTINLYSATGTNAAVTATLNAGKIDTITVDNAGSDYELDPQIFVQPINAVSAKFDIANRNLISTSAIGTGNSLFAEFQEVGEGVFRLVLTGKINTDTINPNFSHSFSAIVRLLKDGQALYSSEDGIEIFGVLVNEGSTAQTYIEVPIASSAEALISELDVDNILLENGDNIASGDDVYVLEDLNNGRILDARIINAGSKYVTEPTLAVQTTDNGFGLTIKGVLGRGGGITGVDVISGGSGYINYRVNTQPGQFNLWQANTLYSFRPGVMRHANNLYRLGGSGAFTTSSVPPTHTSGTVTVAGVAYTWIQKAMTITVSEPDQEGYFVNSITVSSGGTGYVKTPIVTIDPPASPNGVQAKAYAVLSGGSVSQIVVYDKGSGYNGNEIIRIGPTPNGLNASAFINFSPIITNTTAVVDAVLNDNGELQSVTVLNQGSGYNRQPVFTISNPLETGDLPILTANLAGSEITDVVIENAGSGYIEIPTLTTPAPTSPLRGIVVTNPGSGYTVTPSVVITGGGGSGAQAGVVLTESGEIDYVVVTDGGSGYTSAPTVTIVSDVGTGATAVGLINTAVETGTAADIQVGFVLSISSVSAANDTLTFSSTDAAKLHPNDLVTISSTGTLPGGISATTPYHIVEKSGNTVKLSLLPDGAPIDITSAGTGTRTLRFFSVANERLETPTDVFSIVDELSTPQERNEFVEEINTDRFHLSIPERGVSFVIPTVQIEPTQINFVQAVEFDPPETIVSSLPGVYFEYPPNDLYPVAGQTFERVLILYVSQQFYDSVEVGTAVTYNTANTSVVTVPFVTRGRTYFIGRKVTIDSNYGITLREKIDGPEVVWDDSNSFVIGGQLATISIKYQQLLDAIFLAPEELARVNNGDLVFFYKEAFSDMPTGLTDRRMYYVVQKSEASGYIKFSNTLNGPPINLTDDPSTVYRGSFFIFRLGSASDHSLTSYKQELTMDSGDLAGFSESDIVVYDASSESIGNLVPNSNYRISLVDPIAGTFKLLDASTFVPVAYTSNASLVPGTHKLTKVTDVSNRFVFSQEVFDALTENTEVTYLPTGGVAATATPTASQILYDVPTETFSGGGIESPITVNDGGAFYTSPPNVTFIDTAVLRPVARIVLLNKGSNYNVPPAVTLLGGGGEGATAEAVLDVDGSIAAIKITNPGSGYFSAPLVELSVQEGNSGSGASAESFLLPVGNGATATTTIVNGQVTAINVVNAGSNYISPSIIVSPPDTRIQPLETNKAYFLVNRDAATRSFYLSNQANGLPIRLLSTGSATHLFETVSQFVEYDMTVVNNYINATNDILYYSINKTGNLSDKYEEIIRLQNLDRILLETSVETQRKFDLIGNEESEKRTIPANDTILVTGDIVLFDTDTETSIGLTPGEFYFIRRQVDTIGNGFSFYSSLEDAELDQNRIPLNTNTFASFNDLFRLVRFDQTQLEVGQIRSIRLRDRGSNYKSLPRVFIDVPETRFGTGGVLKPISEGIGGIRRIRVDDPGFDYETARNFIIPVNLHLYQVSNANFRIGEQVTVSGTLKGTVKSWDAQVELLTLDIVTGATFTVDTTIVGSTSGASGKILEIGKAVATADPTALSTFGGFYYGRKNLINEVNIRLQDSRVYQDFSYVVKSSKPYNLYSDVLKKTVHPAGIFVTGFVDYQVVPKNSSINTVNLTEVIVEVEE